MAKKRLKDLKKSKDVYFRRRAKLQALDPITDLNTEIRKKPKSLKGTKDEIEDEKANIKSLEKQNREIDKKVKDLENQYTFEDEEGKKKIELELKKPEYVKRNLTSEKNYLKALQGKDFNFIVDDGFKRYTINTKTLKKYWKEGKDASLPILKKMEKHTEESISYYNKLIEKEKSTATRPRMRKLRRIRDGLQNKLLYTIKQNIKTIETGSTSFLDTLSSTGDKAYSLLFKVVGVNIDKYGI